VLYLRRMAAGRYGAIDTAKAVAVVAVVFTHARRVLFPEVATWDFWLCESWTPFQVPTFLFASGFPSQRGDAVPFARIRERWLRVIVPYALASALAYLVGVARAADARELLFQLATGSPLGVYYYVFLIAVIAPVAWPLSRTGETGAWALLGLCALATAWIAARGPGDWFWSLRNPLDHFALGYFVAGWLARRELPRLERAWRRRRASLALALAAALGLGPVAMADWLPTAAAVPLRIGYALAVVALCAALPGGRSAGPTRAWLSDASLAIYLLHRIFQRLLEPSVAGWPEPVRILALVAVGLGGGVVVARLVQGALGPARARFWLGA
jgi:fucose 4-O-acetylase-like acetyltransferase